MMRERQVLPHQHECQLYPLKYLRAIAEHSISILDVLSPRAFPEDFPSFAAFHKQNQEGLVSFPLPQYEHRDDKSAIG